MRRLLLTPLRLMWLFSIIAIMMLLALFSSIYYGSTSHIPNAWRDCIFEENVYNIFHLRYIPSPRYRSILHWALNIKLKTN